MKTNPGVQNTALLAWDGAAAYPRDVSNFTNWAFCFETISTLAAPAVFQMVAYKALAANPCAPDLATATTVAEVAVCTIPSLTGANATITIPTGTVAGTVCAGTTPCNIGPFVALVPISGAANVRACLLETGIRQVPHGAFETPVYYI